jgi:hypothetical protein
MPPRLLHIPESPQQTGNAMHGRLLHRASESSFPPREQIAKAFFSQGAATDGMDCYSPE